jgi:hypothetical protein
VIKKKKDNSDISRPPISLADLAKHGIHRESIPRRRKKSAWSIAIGASIVGGIAAISVGVISATSAIGAAGSAIGGSTGLALVLVSIATAPAWAVPVAIMGGIFATLGLAFAILKYAKSRAPNKTA